MAAAGENGVLTPRNLLFALLLGLGALAFRQLRSRRVRGEPVAVAAGANAGAPIAEDGAPSAASASAARVFDAPAAGLAALKAARSHLAAGRFSQARGVLESAQAGRANDIGLQDALLEVAYQAGDASRFSSDYDRFAGMLRRDSGRFMDNQARGRALLPDDARFADDSGDASVGAHADGVADPAPSHGEPAAAAPEEPVDGDDRRPEPDSSVAAIEPLSAVTAPTRPTVEDTPDAPPMPPRSPDDENRATPARPTSNPPTAPDAPTTPAVAEESHNESPPAFVINDRPTQDRVSEDMTTTPAADDAGGEPGEQTAHESSPRFELDMSGETDIEPRPITAAADEPAAEMPSSDAPGIAMIDASDYDLAPDTADTNDTPDADTLEMRLELARMYKDMGDREMARGLLEEVAAGGSAGQRDSAQTLLADLGDETGDKETGDDQTGDGKA